MRIIKFRCWVKRTKDMCYPERLSEIESSFKSEDKDHVMMQFTGLQDSKNRDIYESDICLIRGGLATSTLIKIKKGKSVYLKRAKKSGLTNKELKEMAKKETNALCIVEWCDTIGGGWTGQGLAYIEEQGEVIGNIYENPKLLKKK